MILTEEQQMIRDAAREFAQEQLAPNADAWSKQAQVPMNVLHAMGELGFMGMTVPEEWGGVGSDYVSYALALEEIAAGDGATSTIMSVNTGLRSLVKRRKRRAKTRVFSTIGKRRKDRCVLFN